MSPSTIPTLTVFCADPIFASRITERVGGWAGKSAKILVTSEPTLRPTADIVIVSALDFGTQVEASEFLPLPSALRASEHPLQRNRILEVYRDTLTSWAGEVYAIPLRGDGFVTITRADRFADMATQADYRRRFARSLLPPRTWEDYTETAQFFTERDGKPSLPALSQDPAAFMTHFLQMAACYDRPARRDGTQAVDTLASVSFLVDLRTGKPRFSEPGFLAALKQLSMMAKFRSPTAATTTTVLSSLDAGATLAIVDMLALGALPKDAATGAVDPRFTVSPLPGTEVYFDVEGKAQKIGSTGNYIPYFGATTYLGTVRKTCQQPDVAWEILAQAAGPAGSLAVVGDPKYGTGPFRREHTDESRDAIWLGYRFDEAGSRKLSAAMRAFPALDVLNPTTLLRLPDIATRWAAIEPSLRAAAEGKTTPEEAARTANSAWERIDATQPQEVRARQLRHATGQK